MIFHNNTLDIDYYTIEEAPKIFDIILENNELNFVGGKKKKYLDISASFDIESTSFKDYNNNKCSLMYIWQFGITDDKTKTTYVFIGREWSEFFILLETLASKFMTMKRNKVPYYFPIYIHNLAFEFSFLRPLMKKMIQDTFFLKENSPLYFRTDLFEFRCSYMLSGMSLGNLPTTIKKLKGDLDYDKLRNSKTVLTDKEMAYCLNDVRVLCEYISIKREQDGDISKIPYTKTGYVRRGLRVHCMGTEFRSDKRSRYIKTISNLALVDFREYFILKKAYQGGHTAANPWYNGKTVNNVTCYDFTSSYPSVMVCSNDFPIAFYRYEQHMDIDKYMLYYNSNKAIVCRATFKNLRSKHNFDSWIPASKAETLNFEDKKYMELNNGKITKAKELTMYITNIDFDIYNMFYEWDSVEFDYCYTYIKGYLPKSVIEYVLKLYKDKTELKGLEDEDSVRQYALSKELLNSLYGMAVTAVDKYLITLSDNGDDYSYEGVEEYQDDDKEYLQARLDNFKEKCENYNKNIYRGQVATPYQWGVYISALARYNLALGIMNSGTKGLWVYADTDSIYVKDADKIKPFIEAYNKHIENKMLAMCDFYGMDKDCWRPKNENKERKPLGYWDFDGHSKQFKTLGAKRYIKRTDDDKLKITVAGLSKKDGCEYLYNKYGIDGVFDAFEDTLEIPAENTGKLTHTILNVHRTGILKDYNGVECEYDIYGGTYLEPATFNLSIDSIYLQFLFGLEEDYMR